MNPPWEFNLSEQGAGFSFHVVTILQTVIAYVLIRRRRFAGCGNGAIEARQTASEGNSAGHGTPLLRFAFFRRFLGRFAWVCTHSRIVSMSARSGGKLTGCDTVTECQPCAKPKRKCLGILRLCIFITDKGAKRRITSAPFNRT